jgi:hypothetical protein
MTLTCVRCASTDEAVSTFEYLGKGLGLHVTSDGQHVRGDATRSKLVKFEKSSELEANPSANVSSVDELAKSIRKNIVGTDKAAVLVTGHQPLLSRLADSLLRTHWWRRVPPVPLDHSDIVCIAVDGQTSWLEFVISYDDRANADLVRQKIERKMESAKLLGGLLTIGITVLCGVLFDKSKFDELAGTQWAVQLGTTFFLIAAVLYLATMYAYDTLLMPQRFWGESHPKRQRRPVHRRGGERRRHRWLVERPPSSAAWILYQNMMRIWRTRFTLASVFLIAGTAFLAYAALRIELLVLIPVGVVVSILVVLWIRASRPLLGSQD